MNARDTFWARRAFGCWTTYRNGAGWTPVNGCRS